MTLDTAAPLKSGWRRVKFGDVVRLSKARSQNPLADGLERYVGLEHLEPGDLRIRSWGNVADGTTFTNRFEPGQVLLASPRVSAQGGGGGFCRRVLGRHLRAGEQGHGRPAAGVAAVYLPDGCVLRACGRDVGGVVEPEDELDELSGFRPFAAANASAERANQAMSGCVRVCSVDRTSVPGIRKSHSGTKGRLGRRRLPLESKGVSAQCSVGSISREWL